MFETYSKRRRKYSMPWEKPKQENDAAWFERGRKSRFFFSEDEPDASSRFHQYFAFKTVRRIKRGLHGNAMLRNRFLFICLCLFLLGYALTHAMRGS